MEPRQQREESRDSTEQHGQQIPKEQQWTEGEIKTVVLEPNTSDEYEIPVAHDSNNKVALLDDDTETGEGPSKAGDLANIVVEQNHKNYWRGRIVDIVKTKEELEQLSTEKAESLREELGAGTGTDRMAALEEEVSEMLELLRPLVEEVHEEVSEEGGSDG